MPKDNPSLPREIAVQVAGKEVAVKKLPLGRIAQLAGLLDAVPGLIAEVTADEGLRQAFSETDTSDYAALGTTVVQALPKLLGTAEDFVISLIAVGAGLEKPFVRDEVGLDEALELVVAIFTVNNLGAIQKHAKNLMRLFGVNTSKLLKQAQTNGSKT